MSCQCPAAAWALMCARLKPTATNYRVRQNAELAIWQQFIKKRLSAPGERAARILTGAIAPQHYVSKWARRIYEWNGPRHLHLTRARPPIGLQSCSLAAQSGNGPAQSCSLWIRKEVNLIRALHAIWLTERRQIMYGIWGNMYVRRILCIILSVNAPHSQSSEPTHTQAEVNI